MSSYFEKEGQIFSAATSERLSFEMEHQVVSRHIPGGIQSGTKIKVKGTPKANAQRFSINIQTGSYDDSNIAFHFDARFNYDEKEVVVCNNRINRSWGVEERTRDNFPFKEKTPYEIVITRGLKAFHVAVNGSHFLQFKHRPNSVAPDCVVVCKDTSVEDLVVEIIQDQYSIDFCSIYNCNRLF